MDQKRHAAIGGSSWRREGDPELLRSELRCSELKSKFLGGCFGFLALSGWWLSSPLTVVAQIGGGVVKVVERSGGAGAGSVVSWRFGLFLD